MSAGTSLTCKDAARNLRLFRLKEEVLRKSNWDSIAMVINHLKLKRTHSFLVEIDEKVQLLRNRNLRRISTTEIKCGVIATSRLNRYF